jgi:hypothetical protein
MLTLLQILPFILFQVDTVCPPEIPTIGIQHEIIRETNDYQVSQISYDSLPIGGTLLMFNDDQNICNIPIGFSFSFYGNCYTSACISSNGWVGFTPGQTVAFTAQAMPNTNFLTPRNCLGLWKDYNPGVMGNGACFNAARNYIYYRTEGTYPYRRFVVSWVNIPDYQCTAICGGSQVVLYEFTNRIQVNIFRKVTCLAWAGGVASLFTHNATGTVAHIAGGRNATVWTAFRESWQWIPSGVPVNVQISHQGANNYQVAYLLAGCHFIFSQNLNFTYKQDCCEIQINPNIQ